MMPACPCSEPHCTGNIRDIDFFEHQSNSNIVDHVLKGGAAYLDNQSQF